MRSFFVTCALAAATVAGCGSSEPSTNADGTPKELILGLVPSRETNVLIENVDPLADFISAQLGIPVKSFVSQDYTGLVEAMGSGRADIGLIPPFASMLGNERYGIETVLISVRYGKPTYRAQWMTNNPGLCAAPPTVDERRLSFCDAAIDVVRGKQVAFIDPTSTSGHLFPALQLLDAGINPEQDIQSIFIGSHDASAIAIYNGDVEIGVSFEDVRTLLLKEYPDIGEKVIVFNHSQPIPNDGVTVRPDLPAETKDAIERAFVTLAEEQSSLLQEDRLLWRIYEIEGFVDFESSIHDPVRRAFREMRGKIDLNA